MLTLDEIKNHTRIDSTDDDDALTLMLATATAAIGDYLGNPAIALDNTAPAPLKSAALLLIATLYQNRESQSERKLMGNPVFESLLQPYKTFTA